MIRGLVPAVALLLAAILSPRPALAAAGKGKGALSAPELRKRCRLLYRARKLGPAAACFLRLSKKTGASSDLYNAGLSYRRLAARTKGFMAGYYRELSAGCLKKYLRRMRDDPDFSSSRVVAIRGLIAGLRKAVGYTPLSVTTTPPGMEVEISGYEYSHRGKTPFVKNLRPGPYSVAVRSRKGVWTRRRVVLKRLRSQAVSLNFLAPRVKVVIKEGPPPKAFFARPAGWGTISLGLAVGSVVAGVILAIQAKGIHEELQVPYNDPNRKYGEEELSKAARGAAMKKASVGLYVGAGVAAVAGAGLIILDRVSRRMKRLKAKDPTSRKVKTSVAPYFGPGSAGLTLGFTF